MALRNLAFLFALFLFFIPIPAQDKKNDTGDEEKLLQEAKRISEMVDMLDSTDVEIRNAAAKELASIGRSALPFVEQRLKEKGNTQYLELLKSLYTLDRDLEQENKWVNEAEIPKYDEVKKMLPTVPRDDVEKYIYVKYAEAVALYNKANYDKAFDIASALLKLEPKSIYKEHLRKLKQVCDQKIQQGSLVKAQILTDKEFYEFGEKVGLTIRIENIYKDEITIHYADASAKNVKGSILLDIVLTYFDAIGGTTSSQHNDTIPVEREVPIGVGANWESHYTIDSSKDGEDKPNYIRTYLVNARTMPYKIDIAGKPTYRRIAFEPAVVRVYPKGSTKIADKALEALGRAIDGGTLQDVFLCAMLLKDKEKNAGISMLMAALKKLEEEKSETSDAVDTPFHRVIYTSLKYLTSMPYGQDAKQWLEWWEEMATQRAGRDKRQKK